MAMSRFLPEVLEQMIEQIPIDNESLINQLEATKKSSLYAAPEAQVNWWNKTTVILKNGIPYPTDEWHFNILSTFSQIPIKKLKEKYGTK